MAQRTEFTRRVFPILALASALGACATSQATTPPAPGGEARGAVALPADEEAVLRLAARGTQNYECRPKRDAPGELEWALVAPEADLFDSTGKKVGKHYAGPTWESTEDGSKVVGTVKARAESPEPDAVQWLLLTATSSGNGMLGGVKSVQRTDTHGGKPPAGACTAGATVKVRYTATYWFSRARGATAPAPASGY